MAVAARSMAIGKGAGLGVTKDPSILCVRFCAIGDCVMTAWAVSAVRAAYPEASITWAVEDTCSEVVDDQRLVTNRVKADRASWRKLRWSPSLWFSQLRQYSGLRKYGFEYGFDFQGHSKTALCLRLSGAQKRFSHLSTDSFAARLNTQVDTGRGSMHDVEAHFELVDYGLKAKPVGEALMPVYDSLVAPGAIVIQTGASRATKKYPRDQWRQVAIKLVAKGHRVVTIGGQHDQALDLPGVEDLVGQLSLAQALGVLQSATHHIAADTGTGHAAAAYGIPVTSLFGATQPERYRPFGPHVRVLQGPESPAEISPDEIVDAVLSKDYTCAY